MIDAPTLGPAMTAPVSRAISITHAVTIWVACGFQVLGLYTAWVTFGGSLTVALYAVGGLTVVLQHIVARRRASSW